MSSYIIRTYSSYKELPPLLEADFFHSSRLFDAFEQTPASVPFMFVAYHRDAVERAMAAGQDPYPTTHIAGQILAIVRRRKGLLLLPHLFAQGRIYGEGVYGDGVDKEEVFEALLHAITRKFVRRLCLYVEFSNLGSKMFGYRIFRTAGYFPVRWMQITNHIASADDADTDAYPTDERNQADQERIERHIARSQAAGIRHCRAENKEQVAQFYTMMRNYYRFKLQRILPRRRFFEVLQSTFTDDESNPARHLTLLTLYKEKVIGGCTMVINDKEAFLWYIAARRKVYVKYHPATLTVVHALQEAEQMGVKQLHFMNTGIPFRKNRYRDFLLQFGGNPSSSYRWFRVSIGWLNKLLRWIYRE